MRQSIYRERFKRELLPGRVAIAKRRVAIAKPEVAIAKAEVAIARLGVVIARLGVAIAKGRVGIAELRVPVAKFPGTLLCKGLGVSPHRGEMFIATSTPEKDLAPLGAKRWPPQAKVISLLTELSK